MKLKINEHFKEMKYFQSDNESSMKVEDILKFQVK